MTLFDMSIYDHCMNYIEDSKMTYLFDSNNRQIFEYIGNDYIRTVIAYEENIEQAEKLKILFADYFLFGQQGNVKPTSLHQQDINEMKYTINEVRGYWIQHRNSAEEFYQNNKRDYEQMSEIIDRVEQKQKRLKII